MHCGNVNCFVHNKDVIFSGNKVFPKRWYPTTSLHGFTTRKTAVWISAALETMMICILRPLVLALNVGSALSVFSLKYSHEAILESGVLALSYLHPNSQETTDAEK
jgi:hypothetical protein